MFFIRSDSFFRLGYVSSFFSWMSNPSQIHPDEIYPDQIHPELALWFCRWRIRRGLSHSLAWMHSESTSTQKTRNSILRSFEHQVSYLNISLFIFLRKDLLKYFISFFAAFASAMQSTIKYVYNVCNSFSTNK